MDELVAPPGRGVILLSMDEESAPLLEAGMTLTDALGREHTLASVTLEEGLYTLHFPQGDPAYFERRFPQHPGGRDALALRGESASVSLICVGKLKEPFYFQAAEEYRKRLKRLMPVEVIELPDQREPVAPSPALNEEVMRREGRPF